MSAGFPYFLSSDPNETATLRRNWGWVLALGVALTFVGGLAIAYPVAATVTTVELFGILLVLGGAVEVAGGLWAGRRNGFLLHILCGLLSAFLGIAILDRPLLGAAGYTLVLAVFFVASGLTRVVFALSRRFSGWGWVLLNGVIGVALGGAIWRELPEAALWVIGTFVGIDLVFNGLSWVMVAVAARRVLAGATTAVDPVSTRA